MGVAAILVMWPGLLKQTFVPPSIRSLHMKFEFNWPSSFRGDVWKCWQMDDRRWSHCYTISSPRSLQLRWAKMVLPYAEFSNWCLINEWKALLLCPNNGKNREFIVLRLERKSPLLLWVVSSVNFCLVCGLTSQSKAMVMSRPSVDLTTHCSWASLDSVVIQYSVHILKLVTDNSPSWINGRMTRKYFTISMKVWGRVGIELLTTGSTIRLATDCATGPGYPLCTTDVQPFTVSIVFHRLSDFFKMVILCKKLQPWDVFMTFLALVSCNKCPPPSPWKVMILINTYIIVTLPRFKPWANNVLEMMYLFS